MKYLYRCMIFLVASTLLITTTNAATVDFDNEYKKALYVADFRAKQGENYPPDRYLAKIFNSTELKKAGFGILKNAKGNLDEIEKGLYFLIGAENHIKGNGLEYPENIHAGLAAKKVAEKYSDIKNKEYDLDKALYLHGEASDWGIQSSAIAEGYLLRFKMKGKPDEYSWKDVEIRAFGPAAICTKERVTRKYMPYKKEFCELAQNEMKISEQMKLNLAPSERDKKQNADSDGAFWAVIGLVGLTALALSSGAEPSNSPPPDYVGNATKSWVKSVNQAELEFAFTD